MKTDTEVEGRRPLARVDKRIEGIYAVIHRVLILGVAITLIILAAMALWDTVVLVHEQLDNHDLTKAITVGVDTAFLTVILLELLHTVIVQAPLARQVPDFIIIGITSAIRHGLGLVASATVTGGETVNRTINGQVYKITVPGSGNREAVISLVINSGGVLLLVIGLWIVRQSFSAYDQQRDHANAHSAEQT